MERSTDVWNHSADDLNRPEMESCGCSEPTTNVKMVLFLAHTSSLRVSGRKVVSDREWLERSTDVWNHSADDLYRPEMGRFGCAEPKANVKMVLVLALTSSLRVGVREVVTDRKWLKRSTDVWNHSAFDLNRSEMGSCGCAEPMTNEKLVLFQAVM